MSGEPSGSSSAQVSGSGAGGNLSTPTRKAIGSLAKKQSEVTRQGTQKLKFVPVLPARRKKDTEVKAEAQAPAPVAINTDVGRGRGRGRGPGEERARGKGVASFPAVEMTASGPFAMGPTMAWSSARRVAPRSNFTPIVPTGGPSSLGLSLSHSAAPTLKKEVVEGKTPGTKGGAEDNLDDVEELYSDPDEGVEIIDMENVRQMDWMAPESLRKDRGHTKKSPRVKKVVSKEKSAENLKWEAEEDADKSNDVDTSNALHLSDSEEEEELEDLIEDFALSADPSQAVDIRQERLYFFQFPTPFPTFVSNARNATFPPRIDPEMLPSESSPKKVTFAPDAKGSDAASATGSASASTSTPVPQPLTKDEDISTIPVDGIIGQLEIYRSGKVKMRLGDGILLDVTPSTQPSFLQHAVHLDMTKKRLSVIGEVNKRFVVSPNVESLLTAMEEDDRQAMNMPIEGVDGLISMDTS